MIMILTELHIVMTHIKKKVMLKFRNRKLCKCHEDKGINPSPFGFFVGNGIRVNSDPSHLDFLHWSVLLIHSDFLHQIKRAIDGAIDHATDNSVMAIQVRLLCI